VPLRGQRLQGVGLFLQAGDGLAGLAWRVEARALQQQAAVAATSLK
jgi:hypothetical protein